MNGFHDGVYALMAMWDATPGFEGCGLMFRDFLRRAMCVNKIQPTWVVNLVKDIINQYPDPRVHDWTKIMLSDVTLIQEHVTAKLSQ